MRFLHAVTTLFSGHVDQVTALTIDGMGRIASGSTDFTIKVWDVDTGKCVRTMRDHYGIILAMTTLKSGKIISSAADRSVKVGCWAIFMYSCHYECASIFDNYSVTT